MLPTAELRLSVCSAGLQPLQTPRPPSQNAPWLLRLKRHSNGWHSKPRLLLPPPLHLLRSYAEDPELQQTWRTPEARHSAARGHRQPTLYTPGPAVSAAAVATAASSIWTKDETPSPFPTTGSPAASPLLAAASPGGTRSSAVEKSIAQRHTLDRSGTKETRFQLLICPCTRRHSKGSRQYQMATTRRPVVRPQP